MSANPLDATIEDLEARHRREKRDLAATITAMKKTVPKGDKRKKKDVTAKIVELEDQLSSRHASEVKSFVDPPTKTADDAHALADAVATVAIADSPPPKDIHDQEQHQHQHQQNVTPPMGLYGTSMGTQPTILGTKKNKTKLRQQRKAEEMRRLQDEAATEAEGMVDVAAIESETIDRLVAADGLAVHDINADGHCLYSAFADQINTYHGGAAAYQDMRKRAADYMRQHQDDFIPFMAHENGDMFSNADFDTHCDRIVSTADWGGHQEITALSHALQTPVLVYQTGMPVLRIGDDVYYDKDPIKLSYHRHAYGLGEHYNSLRKLAP
ncbi:OTU protein [Kickxella alabastrina]|uniref:OTU protein n=1 Tax=Kickxella alabastrina TaxID=61397 RepID=A0ACC1ITQ7_9FUNG|nr:OTU protein [Kickxella alabastrina]